MIVEKDTIGDEKKENKEKKHPLRKILDIVLTIFSIIVILFVLAFIQVFQEAQPKKKEVKPSAQIESLEKKVDSLYQEREREKKDVQNLYSEIRKVENEILKTAKANDEKALLKTEIISLKQDLLMLESNISYPAEEKPKTSKKEKK